MRLQFLYHPVEDVEAAVAFYRDVLGWDEAWRMGEDSAAMAIPGGDIAVMLDVLEGETGASGFFEVDDVDTFYQENREKIDFLSEPTDVPPVRYVAFRDPGGNLIRLYSNLADD